MKYLKLLQLVTATLLIYSSCKHEFQTIETSESQKKVETIQSYVLTDCVKDNVCEYHILINSSIKDSLSFITGYVDQNEEYEFVNTEIQRGKKIVFVYKTYNLPIIMDGGTTLIYFEVDENSTKFSFEDDQLSDIKLIYQIFCYPCYGNISKYITKGVIKGEKLEDSKWYLEIDLPKKDVFPHSEENERIVVKNIFTIK